MEVNNRSAPLPSTTSMGPESGIRNRRSVDGSCNVTAREIRRAPRGEKKREIKEEKVTQMTGRRRPTLFLGTFWGFGWGDDFWRSRGAKPKFTV